MHDWKRFNEKSLPEKEAFYSNLNIEDVTYSDYSHAKKKFKDFEIKYLGESHDLYLKCDTLLLTDVSENFRKICLEIYELDPAKCLSAPGLAWQVALKKTKVKLELLTDIDMLLIVEKGNRGGLDHSINRCAKANNKYMKESSYLKYWDVNNLYGWAMSQKLVVNVFRWAEDLFEFNEDFIKRNEGYFVECDVQYPKNLQKPYNDLLFLLK